MKKIFTFLLIIFIAPELHAQMRNLTDFFLLWKIYRNGKRE